MGVVYHSAYLRYAEAGRAELMRAKGFSYREMEDSGLMLPIIETWMRHYAPARYDEEIDIITWIEDTGGAHVTFCYIIEIDSKPLVECYTKHTCINMENKVVRLPEKIILMAPDA